MQGYEILEINNGNFLSLENLKEESLLEGRNFVRRTIDEWQNGTNTFSKKGEKFWGIFDKNKCIAMGGLNIDPFIEGNDGTIGRVRHLYVSGKYRGKGLSKLLMNLILTEAKKNFKTLRLSTSNPIAVHLYESLGFVKTEGHKVTHTLNDLEHFDL